jgi:hypothetical protein
VGGQRGGKAYIVVQDTTLHQAFVIRCSLVELEFPSCDACIDVGEEAWKCGATFFLIQVQSVVIMSSLILCPGQLAIPRTKLRGLIIVEQGYSDEDKDEAPQ